jgi:hypothetical protein
MYDDGPNYNRLVHLQLERDKAANDLKKFNQTHNTNQSPYYTIKVKTENIIQQIKPKAVGNYKLRTLYNLCIEELIFLESCIPSDLKEGERGEVKHKMSQVEELFSCFFKFNLYIIYVLDKLFNKEEYKEEYKEEEFNHIVLGIKFETINLINPSILSINQYNNIFEDELLKICEYIMKAFETRTMYVELRDTLTLDDFNYEHNTYHQFEDKLDPKYTFKIINAMHDLYRSINLLTMIYAVLGISAVGVAGKLAYDKYSSKK